MTSPFQTFEDFVHSMPAMPWFRPDGDPDPSWMLFREETLGAARGAVESLATEAMKGGAALDAVCELTETLPWNTRWDARWSVAWQAVFDATKSTAAWDLVERSSRGCPETGLYLCVWDAAWDARFYTLCMFLLPEHPKVRAYQEHIRKRWEVWQKGYALYGDLDGVLYVYEPTGLARLH